MPISATDRYYRAETTPASITALGGGLRDAFGQQADAFGAKGNLLHRSGYHRSRAWILHSPDSRYGIGDYSVRNVLDQVGPDSDVSAFDFTPGDWGSARNRQLMVELTGRVHTAAKARDPRLSNLREFAGTLDGKNVITFNCSDGSLKDPFDDSHLDHVHGSFWRSRANHDHGGLLAVLLGGDTMAALEPSDESYGDLIWRVKALLENTATVTGGPHAGEVNKIAATLGDLGKRLETIAQLLTDGGPPPAETRTLSDADVQRIAGAVLDEEHRRSEA